VLPAGHRPAFYYQSSGNHRARSATTDRAQGMNMTTITHWQELLKRPAGGNHIAQVYQDEEFLTEAVTHFICSGLHRSDGMLVISTMAHWTAFRKHAAAEGFSLEDATQSGQLQYWDADSTLANFMVDGKPDRHLFHKEVGDMIVKLLRQHPTVRVYGEMVDLLWQDGNRAAAVQLEEFWDILLDRQPISLLCAYCMDNLNPAVYGGPIEGVCRTHSHVITDRDYDRLESAVTCAASKILGPSLAKTVRTLAAANQPSANMPFGQSVLLYLTENMPATGDKILSETHASRRSRARTTDPQYASVTSLPALSDQDKNSADLLR
jgi:hypothetical protein